MKVGKGCYERPQRGSKLRWKRDIRQHPREVGISAENRREERIKRVLEETANTKVRTCAEVIHFRDLKEVRKSWAVVYKLGNHKREGVIKLFRRDIMSQVHWGAVCWKY